MTAYETITNRVLSLLEQGVVPWQKPWKGGRAGHPKNLLSQKEYRGINVMMLSCAGYESPYWLTFKQANEIGGSVKKGEKGSPIIKALYRDTDEERQKFCGMKTYSVFNSSQCELPEKLQSLIPVPSLVAEDRRIDNADAIIIGMPNRPGITNCDPHREKVAYYSPSGDYVQVPARTCFDKPEEYYSVMFHELGHSTGHTKRLNRSTLVDMVRFGDTNYSKEELVAEMTAAFLCGQAGIEEQTLVNSAAYLEGWLKRLKKDHTLLVQAAKEAQKAADYILAVPKD